MPAPGRAAAASYRGGSRRRSETYQTAAWNPLKLTANSYFSKTAKQLGTSFHEHDQNHAPDGQQRVSNGVSDGVTQGRHLAFADVADQAQRCGGGARPGDDSQRQRIVESENILCREHAKDQRDRGSRGAPQ